MSVTGGGGACSRADASSRRGCGRTTVACCDSVAVHRGKTAGHAAVSGCSRSTRVRCNAGSGWPLRRRSSCRFAETSRTARSFRPPSPRRRTTATASPSSGHFPGLRRFLARAGDQKHPPTALPHFYSTRRLSPRSCHFALQSCAGGECGYRCRSSARIPERFPKCASTGNWQVPSAPVGSKRSQDPLEPSLSITPSRGRKKNGRGCLATETLLSGKQMIPTALVYLSPSKHFMSANWFDFSNGLLQLHSPCKPTNMAHPTARMRVCACPRDLNL